MNNSTQENKKKEQSLFEAYTELEKITEVFERGEVDLEEGVIKFKRGLELAKNLKSRFSKIENEIEEIKTQFQETQTETVQAEITVTTSDEIKVSSTDEIPF